MDIITMQAVKLYRGEKCVLDISALNIKKSELIAVAGPNGSGKSTLLQAINGLLPFKEGKMEVLGIQMPAVDAVQFRRRAGMVFQDPLFVRDTAYENVALPLKFRGFAKGEMKSRVEAAMVAFRCEHLRDRLAGRLSGGESQRVCLARAFVTEPELLLLDEPFSALDPATRNDLLGELKAVASARGVTVLLVSHNMEEVLRFARRAIVMEDGRIVQDDLPEVILRQPVNLRIARLAGMDNIWQGKAENGHIKINPQLDFIRAGMNLGGAVWCCLPGDGFRIAEEDCSPPSGAVELEVAVEQVIPGIGVAQVTARLGELALVLRLAADRAAALVPGQKLAVWFNPNKIHILTK